MNNHLTLSKQIKTRFIQTKGILHFNSNRLFYIPYRLSYQLSIIILHLTLFQFTITIYHRNYMLNIQVKITYQPFLIMN